MSITHNYTPFVYLIGWSRHDKWYIGVKFEKGTTPDVLWTTYKTSSKHVKSFVDKNGEPDVIKVLKKFDNKERAINYEQRLLVRMKCIKDDRFLNRAHSKCIHPDDAIIGAKKRKNTKKWEENDPRRRKISELNKLMKYHERLNTEEARGKAVISRRKTISNMTPEERKNLTRKMQTTDVRKKSQMTRSNWNVEKKMEFQKNNSIILKNAREKINYQCPTRNEKISEAKKISNPAFSKLTCPHCQKAGNGAAMKRWHFDNCKNL